MELPKLKDKPSTIKNLKDELRSSLDTAGNCDSEAIATGII